MRGWLLTFAVLAALTCPGSHASSVYSVSFKGQLPENQEVLKRTARELQDSTQVADSLTRLLVNAGYLDAEVTIEDSTVIIIAGPAALIRAIEVIGDSSYRVNIGQNFTQQTIERAMQKALQLWQSRGYWYATLHLQELRFPGRGEVVARARLSRGPVVSVGDIDFPGLMHTRREVVVRYLPIRTGDTLTPALISRINRASSALDLVRPTAPAEVVPLPGYEQAIIRLPVEEPRQFAFEGAAGLAGDDSESRDLLWSLRLQVNSLFGYGRRLALHTERSDRGRHDLTLSYRQPVFLLGAGWLRADLATRDYSDQFYELAGSADVSTSLAQGIGLGFGLGWKTVSPDSQRPAFNRYDLAVTFDGYDLDHPSNPSSGWQTNWRVTFSHRRYHDDTVATVPQSTALDESRVELAVARYQPIWRRWLVHLGLSFNGLQTKEKLPPLSELILLGGPTTVRGFRSEQFSALQAAWGTIEPRLHYHWGYVATFLDLVYLRNRLDENDHVITAEDFEYGYGIGLGVTGSRGGVSVSLAWNPQLAFDQPYLAVRFNAEL